MHIRRRLTAPNSAAFKQLTQFKKIIAAGKLYYPLEDDQFVFLCGANKSDGTPSGRRNQLLVFAERNLPRVKFFLAEDIFSVLSSEGHKSNFLDVENDILKLSDYVIVILESESSFCELGAFSYNEKLREKLIVINDVRHKLARSFINIGPIAAILESSTENRVLHYRMDETGKENGDGIGNIFPELKNILISQARERHQRVKSWDITKEYNKDTMRLLHDIINMAGPLNNEEVIDLVNFIFNSVKKNLISNRLGLLVALKEISRNNNGYYKSSKLTPYLHYGDFDITDFIATFKSLHMKYDPLRFS